MTRRTFFAFSAAARLSGAAGRVERVPRNAVAEWTLLSAKSHADPFNEIELDAVFEGAGNRTWRVPAFWRAAAASSASSTRSTLSRAA
jgi:hypothetical protein